MSSKRTRRTQYRRYAPPAKPVESVEYPPMAGDLLRAASLRFGEFVTDAGEMFVFANRAVRRGRAALTHKRIRVDAGGETAEAVRHSTTYIRTTNDDRSN